MKCYIQLFFGLIVMGSFIFGCETIVDQIPDANISLSTEDLPGTYSADLCQSACIDPDDPEFIENTESQTVQWGNPRNPFKKSVDIIYYNTLTHFVLKVKSSHNIADILVDDESIKNFRGTLPPNTWQEFTFDLEEDWEACDTWAFVLKVTGFGPPVYFDVEYQLIGECVYYTLSLAVNPEDAGTVTGEGEYMEGEQVEITTTENEGYVFVNWTDEDGNEISDVGDFTYTMPAMDKTLTANFDEEDEFVCGISTITDIEGNEYATVLIDDQCWMAENLRVTQYRNGNAIPTNLSNSDWQITTSGTYAWYNNDDDTYGSVYGALYNWYAVNSESGLCPPGWHVPSDEEWTRLTNYLGGENIAGGKMKSTRTVPDLHPRWDAPNTGATNESGFSGFPGGYRHSYGYYTNIGSYGYWWSSTEFISGFAWYRDLYYDASDVYRGDFGDKRNGLSVRCLRDD